MRVEAVADAVARAEAYASAIGAAGVAVDRLWESGLRPSAFGSESSATLVARAYGHPSSHAGVELRPDDIEVAAVVTADFRTTSD